MKDNELFIQKIKNDFVDFLEAIMPPDVFLLLTSLPSQLTFDLSWLTWTCITTIIIITNWIYFYVWLPFNVFQDEVEIGYLYLDNELHTQKRKTMKDLVKNVQQRRHLGDRPPMVPNGWYALLQSADLKTGQVKHIQALGENFAVMRSSTGKSYVLDAYCPHLGANMAVGGVVRGDCLECPFHGWQFRGDDGTCSHIPYSDKAPKSAVAKTWTSYEGIGYVFVWYHAEGIPPTWEIPHIPEIDTGTLGFQGRSETLINAHIQDLAENIADYSHFEAIHTASMFAGSDLRIYKRFVHSFLHHSWKPNWKAHPAPDENHMCTLTMEHTFVLFKKYRALSHSATVTQHGPGLLIVKDGENYVINAITPIDNTVLKTVNLFYCRPFYLMFGRIILYNLTVMLNRDIQMWSYKKYTRKPNLVKEDEAIARHRRWFSQFYTENSPQFFPHRMKSDW